MKARFVNQIEKIGNTQHIVTVKMISMRKLVKMVKKCKAATQLIIFRKFLPEKLNTSQY